MASRDNTVDNVLLLVIDALRRDRVGAYSQRDLTPNLDSLATDGRVYDRAYSCINTTDPSMTTIHTGQYPVRHGLLSHGSQITDADYAAVNTAEPVQSKLRDTHQTIACDLLGRWHERGFDSYLNPVKATRNPWLQSMDRTLTRFPNVIETAVRRGYRQVIQPGTSQDSGRYVDAAAVSETLVDAIKSSDDQWFAMAHYWDTHIPYFAPKSYIAKIQDHPVHDDDRLVTDAVASIGGSYWADRLTSDLTPKSTTVGDVVRRYDASVAYVDAQIGSVLDQLEARGELENTLVIVTADHGESLTEHDIFFEHHGLYDVSTAVPLIISGPEFDGRDDRFVQHFDIVPTILSELGKDYDESQYDGYALRYNDATDRGAVYCEESHTSRRRAIRTDTYKLITALDQDTECRYCETDHAPPIELYNIRDDPAETKNIAPENTETVERLTEKLSLWIDNLPDQSTDESATYEPDTDVLDQLDAMGYK